MLRYPFSKGFVLASTSLLLIIAGCDQSALKKSADTEDTTAEVTPTEKEKKINAALDAMAQDVAAALQHRPVRELVKEESEDMLAGEPNVLFQTIASKNVEGLAKDGETVTFKDVLARQRAGSSAPSSKAMSKALEGIEKDAASIPKFDIGVPVNLEDWDPEETTPLVAFHHRQEIDDTELERVKAYDADGNVHWLDAFEKPDRPVVDVGINERTTAEGKVRPAYQGNNSKSVPIIDPCSNCGGGDGGDDFEYGDRLVLEKIYLSKDRDIDYPWGENAPEVELRVRSIDAPGSDRRGTGYNEFAQRINGVGGNGEEYKVKKDLFNWTKDVGDATVWFFFDFDGAGDGDARSITTNGQTYVFTRGYYEDSDKLGWKVVSFDDGPTTIEPEIKHGWFELGGN